MFFILSVLRVESYERYVVHCMHCHWAVFGWFALWNSRELRTPGNGWKSFRLFQNNFVIITINEGHIPYWMCYGADRSMSKHFVFTEEHYRVKYIYFNLKRVKNCRNQKLTSIGRNMPKIKRATCVWKIWKSWKYRFINKLLQYFKGHNRERTQGTRWFTN